MKDLLARCKRRGDLLPILEDGQARYGYLPPEFLKGLAEVLDLPVNEIYGVASFYSFLSTRPLGRNTIRVCKCLPCYLKGGQDLMESIRAALGIGIGETTSDGSFSLLVTNCIGACDQAPAMIVNGDRYGKMDSAGIKEVLARYR